MVHPVGTPPHHPSSLFGLRQRTPPDLLWSERSAMERVAKLAEATTPSPPVHVLELEELQVSRPLGPGGQVGC